MRKSWFPATRPDSSVSRRTASHNVCMTALASSRLRTGGGLEGRTITGVFALLSWRYFGREYVRRTNLVWVSLHAVCVGGHGCFDARREAAESQESMRLSLRFALRCRSGVRRSRPAARWELGGGGGNRTRVRKPSTTTSTCVSGLWRESAPGGAFPCFGPAAHQPGESRRRTYP